MTEVTNAQVEADPGDFATLILGIGNILWADEGFGVRAVEALHQRFAFPPDVCVMDGGTQGIFLLPWVRSARRLLIFDAVDFGLPPATLQLIRGEDVPRYMGAKKVSMHQAGFQEVLSSADLAGELPDDIALVGMQPEVLNDYGGSLRPSVRAQIDAAVELACDVLDEWGVSLQERAAPPHALDLVGPSELDITEYEEGRPVAEERRE
jgi:hydrogenase maturation protease